MMPPMTIGAFYHNLDGRLLSFIYVDGKLSRKEQISSGQLTIPILEEEISFGIHKVECKQYAENDETGEVVFYRSAEYEVVKK